MDLKDIKTLYRFLKSTDIVELEVEDHRGRVRIKRQGAEPEQALPRVLSEPPPSGEEAQGQAPSNVKIITSPMVGIFYRASSPEVPPFVEMGTHVKASQVVCVIEAMKIMNEIESEYSGRVVAVLVENGQPVEYGEPIFHIEV